MHTTLVLLLPFRFYSGLKQGLQLRELKTPNKFPEDLKKSRLKIKPL